MADRWTPQEDTTLKDIYRNILERLQKPWMTIRRRAVRLDLHRDQSLIDEDRKLRFGPRSDAWTPEEEALLRDIYPHNTKETILSKIDRSWGAIYIHAQFMGLHRDREIVVQEMISGGKTATHREDLWSTEEDDTLRKIYPVGSKDDITAKLPKRTWKSIREHAIRLNLTRNNDQIQQERIATQKETMLKNYGVEYSTQLPSMQEKSRQTNLDRRGVAYPTQSESVKEKVKETVRAKYGVDNVFQAPEIKLKAVQTSLFEFGVEHPTQSPKVQAKTQATNQERYGVDNTFQLQDRIKAGMVKKYGVEHPQQHPDIREKTQETNLQRYGAPTPSQNSQVREKLIATLNTPEVKEKKYQTRIHSGSFKTSSEEMALLEYLKQIDSETETQKLHPITRSVIDFYLPKYDLWAQYDGSYWHNEGKSGDGPQAESIKKIIERDKMQNEMIPNLIRFKSDEVTTAVKSNTIISFLRNCIDIRLKEIPAAYSHQYAKKLEHYGSDIATLPFNPESLSASDFDLLKENFTPEITEFIEKYEWLGTIGVSPKWCFTARYRGFLGGVVLINEPTSYSKILGEDTPTYEALIQRGATVSWAPKNLGSRLIMFACKWVVQNTTKRAFVGYSDISANERGIIYQACGFDYLGDKFGNDALYRHPYFGKAFSSQSLSRTSVFKKWCRENDIQTKPTWFKENGFKNLSEIPEDIRAAWQLWKKKIISESEKICIRKKRKYVLILGKNKREKKILISKKTYEHLPYPKEILTASPSLSHGKTTSRGSGVKIQFLKDNYDKLSRDELAEQLGENRRWVKRRLQNLFDSGALIPHRPQPAKEDMISEDKWTEPIKARAFELRRKYLKTLKEVSETLNKEFGFKIETGSLHLWLHRLGCPALTKQEWLKEYFPAKEATKLIEQKYRLIDISKHLQAQYGIRFSEDLLGLHLSAIGVSTAKKLPHKSEESPLF